MMAKKKLGKLKSRFDKKTKSKAIVKAEKPGPAKLSKADAQKLQDSMIAHFEAADQNLIAAALDLAQFKGGEGWLALGYDSMTLWREEEMRFSEFYNLTNVMKLLDAGVAPERIEKLKLTNINKLVRKLPESKWTDEKTLELAEGPIGVFKAKVDEQSEKIGMHVEALERRGFQVSKSVADSWDLALKVAEMVDGCGPMEKRVEAIVANYLNAESETPGRSRLQLYEDSTTPKRKAS